MSQEMIYEILVGDTPLEDLYFKWGISLTRKQFLRQVRSIRRGAFPHIFKLTKAERERELLVGRRSSAVTALPQRKKCQGLVA